MTFEELKTEADRQGYNLVKKYQPMPKLLRCPICGSLARMEYGDVFYVTCKKGCLIGPKVNRLDSSYTSPRTGTICRIQTRSKLELERNAREAWNEMVSTGMEEEHAGQ